MPIDTKRILQHFTGMDENFQREMSSLQTFMKTAKDKYNDVYIWSFKDTTKKAILSDKQERVQKAIEEINAIKAEMKVRKFKDPYADIPGPVVKTEDKILIELQRMQNMQVFRAEMDAASNAQELHALFERYQDNADFDKLFQPELKKRMESDKGTQYKMLQDELNAEPQEFKELAELESTLKFIGNGEHYPAGIEQNGLDGIEFKPISFETGATTVTPFKPYQN
jgi:hypothetical protein